MAYAEHGKTEQEPTANVTKEELGSLKTTQAAITGSIWKSNWHIAHGYAEAFPPLVRT